MTDQVKLTRGHVFIVRGDILKLDCDAFAVSASGDHRTLSSTWSTQLPGYEGDKTRAHPVGHGRFVYPMTKPGNTAPRPPTRPATRPPPLPFLVPVAGKKPIAGEEPDDVKWFTRAINAFLHAAYDAVAPSVQDTRVMRWR